MRILNHGFGSTLKTMVTLWPMSLRGAAFFVRFHRNIMLSIPAEATYLQEGYKSNAITDYLCPFNVLIKVGYYYDWYCILIL